MLLDIEIRLHNLTVGSLSDVLKVDYLAHLIVKKNLFDCNVNQKFVVDLSAVGIHLVFTLLVSENTLNTVGKSLIV